MLFSLSSERVQRSGGKIGLEGFRVACLHVDRARTGELADETFARCCTRDNTARRSALEYVLAIPRHEVSIVNDILLAFHQLRSRH